MRTVRPSTATSANEPSIARTAAGSPLEHAAPRLLDVEVVQMVQPWIEQIDDAFDRSVHPRILTRNSLESGVNSVAAISHQLSASKLQQVSDRKHK